MSPEELAETIQFLDQLAREHGLGWVLREAEEEAEDQARLGNLTPETRLVAIVDALSDVLRETDRLERALPSLLLDETNAETLVRFDGEEIISEAQLGAPAGAPSSEDLETTLEALARLRELALGGD